MSFIQNSIKAYLDVVEAQHKKNNEQKKQSVEALEKEIEKLKAELAKAKADAESIMKYRTGVITAKETEIMSRMGSEFCELQLELRL